MARAVSAANKHLPRAHAAVLRTRPHRRYSRAQTSAATYAFQESVGPLKTGTLDDETNEFLFEYGPPDLKDLPLLVEP